MYFKELKAIQEANGFLSDDDLKVISLNSGRHLYHLEGVTTFYPHFQRDEVAPVRVQICRDMACHMNCARKMVNELQSVFRKKLATDEHHAIPDLQIDEVSCLGRCDRPVAGIVNDVLYTQRSAEEWSTIINAWLRLEKQDDETDAEFAQRVSKPDSDQLREDCDWADPQNWEINKLYKGYSDDQFTSKYRVLRGFVERLKQESQKPTGGLSQIRVHILQNEIGSMVDSWETGNDLPARILDAEVKSSFQAFVEQLPDSIAASYLFFNDSSSLMELVGRLSEAKLRAIQEEGRVWPNELVEHLLEASVKTLRSKRQWKNIISPSLSGLFVSLATYYRRPEESDDDDNQELFRELHAIWDVVRKQNESNPQYLSAIRAIKSLFHALQPNDADPPDLLSRLVNHLFDFWRDLIRYQISEEDATVAIEKLTVLLNLIGNLSGSAEIQSGVRFIVTGVKNTMAADELTVVDMVYQEIEKAGLLGMGGAGGRVYKKWNEVRKARQKDPKNLKAFVICNADESEPGTFKDRELLLKTPHLIVEAMIIAGLYVQAKKGYIYVRHEYHEQIERLKNEIVKVVDAGLCGTDILDSGYSFDLEVFESPGGYICGEQTALVEAIQGNRAEPRNRPPELQENGLFDMPTLLNNVESFAWIPMILRDQFFLQPAKNPESSELTSDSLLRPSKNWYKAQVPTSDDKIARQFTGRRFFSISGDVPQPGVYEVAIGSTLRELIEEKARGRFQDVKAIALSGPSGGFLPSKLAIADLKKPKFPWHEVVPRLRFLTRHAFRVQGDDDEFFHQWITAAANLFGIRDGIARKAKRFSERIESMRISKTHISIGNLWLDKAFSRDFSAAATGFPLMLGAGIVIYGQHRNMFEEARSCQQFFYAESCGKCVPCRKGTKELLRITEPDHPNHRASDEDGIDLDRQINELREVMTATSICGLGESAANPIQSAIRHFPDDVVEFLNSE